VNLCHYQRPPAGVRMHQCSDAPQITSRIARRHAFSILIPYATTISHICVMYHWHTGTFLYLCNMCVLEHTPVYTDKYDSFGIVIYGTKFRESLPPSAASCKRQNAPNSFCTGAEPQTPLGELTTLPRFPSRMPPAPPSTPRSFPRACQQQHWSMETTPRGIFIKNNWAHINIFSDNLTNFTVSLIFK